MKDPLALWRTKDPLSLSEAAALIYSEPPGLTYDPRIPEERRVRDQLQSAVRELIAAVESGALPAVIQRWRKGGERIDPGFATRDWSPAPRFTPVEEGVDARRSTVARADLEAWCSARGIRPTVFAPSPEDSAQAEAEAGELPEYVADKISALRFAWRKHWANAEPKDGATWPKQGAVEQTLKQRGIGSDRICAAVATMIRPPWAKGRPPTGEQ